MIDVCHRALKNNKTFQNVFLKNEKQKILPATARCIQYLCITCMYEIVGFALLENIERLKKKEKAIADQRQCDGKKKNPSNCMANVFVNLENDVFSFLSRANNFAKKKGISARGLIQRRSAYTALIKYLVKTHTPKGSDVKFIGPESIARVPMPVLKTDVKPLSKATVKPKLAKTSATTNKIVLKTVSKIKPKVLQKRKKSKEYSPSSKKKAKIGKEPHSASPKKKKKSKKNQTIPPVASFQGLNLSLQKLVSSNESLKSSNESLKSSIQKLESRTRLIGDCLSKLLGHVEKSSNNVPSDVQMEFKSLTENILKDSDEPEESGYNSECEKKLSAIPNPAIPNLSSSIITTTNEKLDMEAKLTSLEAKKNSDDDSFMSNKN